MAVKFTNLQKLIWPAEGITKGDLIDYFSAVSRALISEVRNRPLTLVRAPDGIEGFTFFQKKAPDYSPDWIQTVTLPAPSVKHDVRYILCNRTDTLLWMGNQAAVELHPWLSRAPKVEEPDLLAFDLDPPEGRFDLAVSAAGAVREVLLELGLRSVIKTTGGKGLHIISPLSPGHSFSETANASMKIAQTAREGRPDLMTLEMRKASRDGRVLVDIGRNAPGATVVSAFSPRRRPGATVSFPVLWSDIDRVAPEDFTIRTVPGLLETPAVKDWQEARKRKQRIPRSLR